MVGCITVLAMALMKSGDYLIARLFNPELKLTTYKTFLEICPPELIIEHRVADQIIKIRSSDGGISNVIFRGMEAPEKHRSLNLNAVYLDEASQISEEAFTLLQSRLRGKAFRKIIATTNPNGHSWLYRYWIKKDFGNEKAKRNFLAIHAPSTENIHLPDGYVDNMLNSWSEERIKREVMGSWDAFAGQIYTEFERAKHVVKPFRIPEDWTKVVGIDHGFRNPTCALWGAIDYDSNIYIYREYYKSERLIEETCKEMQALSRGEKISGFYIDPSTKANRGKDSDFTTYLENFPKEWSLIPANNEVSQGIDRVKSYLKVSERTGKPRLFIFDTCEHLLEEITQYRWEELTPGQEMQKNVKEQPVKKDDHSVDALRYLIMSRPEEPKLDEFKASQRNQSTLSGSVQRELHQLKTGGAPKDPWNDFEYGKDTRWDDGY